MKKKKTRSKSKPAGSIIHASRTTPRTDTPEVNLPTDPMRFWRASQELSAFESFPEKDRTPALKTLGPLPFPRGGFPVMGFLATLYEHVARYAAEALDGGRDATP